jgi:hypothetical protein
MARSANRYLEEDFPNLFTKEDDGRISSGTVSIKSDKDNGNYDVKQKTDAGETTIYSFDSKTNKYRIVDQSLYNKFFSGLDGGQQKNRLDTAIKGATVDAAKNDIPDNSLGGTNDLENLYTNMLASDGYLSFNNTVDFDLGITPEDFEFNNFGSNAIDWTGEIDPNLLTFDSGLDLFASTDFDTSDTKVPFEAQARAIDFQKGKTFFYPETMPDLGYDFIKFTSYKYVKAGLQVVAKESAASRIFKDKITEVMLPMLPNITESNSVDWGGDKANAIQLALGNRAAQGIEAIGDASIEKLIQSFQGGIEDIKAMMKDPASSAAVAAYFAGQAVGANIFTRATGTVLNPNLELLFNGPTLRTFNFNFRLTPRTRTENDVIRKIIKSFKRNMAAQRSESDLFLLTPNVYKIEYIFGGTTPPSTQGPHPYMNKIKPCALRSFNVNYGPDGSYMTYPDGGMTCYEIQLQFGELEPIYADEIKENDDNMSY